ncbi:hypothetical protein LJR034_003658 [Caballeronia sp. LjRoot34]|uniref:hypothetical protein n=1 Tax=Caballeronia sp. LjRoot34 TaxID=3342325 RepID=UPI003ECEC947
MNRAIRKAMLAGVSVAFLCGSTAAFAQGGGNGNGGSGGGNAHSAATAGMTHWGDPVAMPTSSMPGNMQSPRMDNSASMGAMPSNGAKGVAKNAQ